LQQIFLNGENPKFFFPARNLSEKKNKMHRHHL